MNKKIIVIISFILFSFFSCSYESEPLYAYDAYFVSSKEFVVLYHGNAGNVESVDMKVKKTGEKTKWYYNLRDEISFSDAFKGRFTVKADKSYFSLDDEGLEVILIFRLKYHSSEWVTVRKK